MPLAIVVALIILGRIAGRLKPAIRKKKRWTTMNKNSLLLTAIIGIALMFLPAVSATTCSVYFTGIGCPHCAKTDPVIFQELIRNRDLFLIEYEIYQSRENGPVMFAYNEKYSTGLGVPLIIFSENNYIIGDTPILEGIEKAITLAENNSCLLLSGSVPIGSLNFSQLPGTPKFWYKERVLVKGKEPLDNKLAYELLFSENLTEVLSSIKTELSSNANKCVPYSGGEVCFEHSVKINDWELYWNGDGIELETPLSQSNAPATSEEKISTQLTLGKIVSLATVDAINPCALAVLTLMLIAIMSYNPKEKCKVLLAGLSFTLAVYILYFFYGLVIVKFFQIVNQLVLAKLWIYKALAVFAVILGLLNLKDVIWYKPGGFLTEMPMSWRPKVKKIISGVTGPVGAFFIGVFVTVFLLPCTMGPYVIAGGMLSVLEFFQVLPWLLFYNVIFVLPMIAITFAIYLGYTTVERTSGWREKNIRYLHAVAGAIMLILGVLMLLGII